MSGFLIKILIITFIIIIITTTNLFVWSTYYLPVPIPFAFHILASSFNLHSCISTKKYNEEEKSLSSEAFSKVSLTNLRRSAVPDLSSDLGMNIFKKVSRAT